MQPKQVSHAAKFLYLSHLTIFTRLDDHNTSANGGADPRGTTIHSYDSFIQSSTANSQVRHGAVVQRCVITNFILPN